MGEARFGRFLAAMAEEPPVSIRLNPQKCTPAERTTAEGRCERVPWCPQGFYLDQRPNFTFDPLLHAGCYYVQEAASMFVHHVVAQLLPSAPHAALDLCAAPGGKSTALRTVLPADCLLMSNEPVRQRAQVLSENVQKWGGANSVVTNNYARDFRKAGLVFDLILCDVPCSGEGMFRKDPASIGEWSPQGVERCQRLQREIVENIWPCLRPGGLLIYSTCTYNTRENEENVRWMEQTLDAQPLAIATETGWGITGSLLEGYAAPVCRFIPGLTRSEGLFMAALRKPGDDATRPLTGKALAAKLKGLNVLYTAEPHQPCPTAELPYPTAIAYLRREAIVLPPDTPRGLVEVCFKGHRLGLVKNIGTRANNLYPREWAIKTTHVPTTYEGNEVLF